MSVEMGFLKLKFMEKKIIRVNVGDEKEYDAAYSVCDEKQEPIDNVISSLVEAKNKGATHVDFGGTCWDWSIKRVHIQPFKLREETDEELKKEFESN